MKVEFPLRTGRGQGPHRPWAAEEVAALRSAYGDGRPASEIDLPGLAAGLGRDKANVCRKARSLGLTNQRRPMIPATQLKDQPKFKSVAELKAAQSESRKAWLCANPHPRGMLGKKHSATTRDAVSKASMKSWRQMTEADIAARSLKSAKTRAASVAAGFVNERQGCTWKAGWREIGRHNKYFRSRWEANYARYLQFLLELGQIDDWEHECETFWFDGVKRGAVSYLPDFKVTERGVVSFHEVKGWMDDRSKTKIRRMAKYHPRVRLILIEQRQYKEIKRKLGAVIPGWEE